jgi:hypothetical protein
LGHLKSFFEKILRAGEAIHAHFRFSASRCGSFFGLLAGASLNGVSGETNLLANILASIQKPRRSFGNLACENFFAKKKNKRGHVT